MTTPATFVRDRASFASRPGRAKADRWWLAACTILSIVPVVTLAQVVRLHHDIPWGDNLTLFIHSRMADGLTLEKLFRFHNEHLIVPTKLVVYVDYLLWHGANILPTAAAVFGVGAIIALYARMLCRRHGEWSAAQAAFATCLLAVILLNGRMTWTLTCPILFQHVSANLLATVMLAAYANIVAGGPRREASWAVLVASAVAAATSSASGVLILPAAVAATGLFVVISPAFRQLSWRGPAAAATAIGAGLLLAYFAAYSAGASQSVAGRSLNVEKAGRFALYFLGGAFLRDSDWPIVSHPDGLTLHVVVLGFWAAFAWALRETWRQRRTLGAFELFHAAVLAFVIVTAGTGGLFRSDLGDLEALNKKYAPTALLAWASVASLIMHFRSNALFRPGMVSGVKSFGLAMVVVLMILPGDYVEFRAWHSWRRQLREAVVALASDVSNEVLLKRFFPNEQLARDMIDKVRGDSAYAFRHLPANAGAIQWRWPVDAATGDMSTMHATVLSASEDDETARVAEGRLPVKVDASLPNMVVADGMGNVIGYGNVSSVGYDGASAEQPEWFACYHLRGGQRALLYAIQRGRAVLLGELAAMGDEPEAEPRLVAETDGHRLDRVPDHADYGFEAINAVEMPLFSEPARIAVGELVRFRGWAVDREARGGATRVEIVVDGRVYDPQHGLPRPDVAKYLKDPLCEDSGFDLSVPAARFGSGIHEVYLRIFLADGRSFLQSPSCSFLVE